MQTTLSFSPSMFSILAPTKAFVFPGRSMPRLHVHTRCLSIETATVACDASTFDYSSMTSKVYNINFPLISIFINLRSIQIHRDNESLKTIKGH